MFEHSSSSVTTAALRYTPSRESERGTYSGEVMLKTPNTISFCTPLCWKVLCLMVGFSPLCGKVCCLAVSFCPSYSPLCGAV